MTVQTPRKSLVEQILEETFTKLETLETFKSENIQQLKKLSRTGGLRRYQQLIEALKAGLGEPNETT